ncbi:MAG: hypothetical protein QOK40_95 [Miltoncostaeaceae bacterium]|jgi:hypothetical protein|nr:hypothetical protein [Miltoncostaeaceae bacterium]
MKTLFVVVGVIVVVVILFSTGVMGGALCVKGIGCLHSTGQGITIEDKPTVTVGTKP